MAKLLPLFILLFLKSFLNLNFLDDFSWVVLNFFFYPEFISFSTDIECLDNRTKTFPTRLNMVRDSTAKKKISVLKFII